MKQQDPQDPQDPTQSLPPTPPPEQEPGRASFGLVSGGAGALPLAFTWGHLVDILSQERGGLAELARHLQDTMPESRSLPEDPLTIERGLRRLRQRGHQEGNKYGKLLLRAYGLPRSLLQWAREMGQYHSRCADLPVSLRQDQLRLWDCPPVSESHAAVWVHLGLASLAHRQKDMDQMARRIDLARLFARDAGAIARCELALLEAWVAFEAGETSLAQSHLEAANTSWGDIPSHDDQSACYFARIQDQVAYIRSRNWRQDASCLPLALALYEAIPLEDAPPFAAFRREHGRAWCLWRMQRRDEALEAATLACQHAGDGGLIRFRVMSLGLQANILSVSREGAPLLARALGMAGRLQDTKLIARLRSFSVSGVN